MRHLLHASLRLIMTKETQILPCYLYLILTNERNDFDILLGYLTYLKMSGTPQVDTVTLSQ